MCIKMSGELRSKKNVLTKKGNNIEILRLLVNYGNYEELVDVANFTKQEIKPGEVTLQVVPRVAARDGRAFLNWATFEAPQYV